MGKKKTDIVSEGNRYDKILKENARKIFTPLLEKLLGKKFKSFEPKQEKMQTTLEREMDFFYEILTSDEELFFLHLEFQAKDEKDVVLRIGEYVAMALKRWKKPIKPVVIHLGEKPSKMRTQLTPEEVYTGFELLNICEMSPFDLLGSDVPELVILTIYSNYEVNDVDQILTLTINRLKQICPKRQLNKFLNQLIMLSKLRKLEEITVKKVAEMINYDMKTDGIYLLGVRAEKERSERAILDLKKKAQKKEAQTQKKAVQAQQKAAEALKKEAEARQKAAEDKDAAIVKLLKSGKLSITEIADIFNVSEAYVHRLKL